MLVYQAKQLRASTRRPSRHRRYPCAHRAQSSRSRRSDRPPPVSARQHPAQVAEVLLRRRAFLQLGHPPLGDERARRHCGTRVNARRRRQRRARSVGAITLIDARARGAHGARTSTSAGCSAQIANSRIYCEIFLHTHGSNWAVLSTTNRRILNRFRSFARIATCIAVIGGTGGCLHGGGWGRVPVCIRSVWRGGLHHRRAGAHCSPRWVARCCAAAARRRTARPGRFRCPLANRVRQRAP